jgi:catechol 2,3-dioxygenase-like lactoylglutathione lyase family enzyme
MNLSVFADDYRRTNVFFEGQIAQGKVLQTNDFVRGDNLLGEPIKDYSSADIRIGWQALGHHEWERSLNLPYFGFGLHSSYFEYNEELGYPNAIYFFFGSPFYTNNKNALNYEFGLGIGYNWKPYDEIENPFNIAIGSHENAFINLKLFYSRDIGKRFKLNAGVQLNHFSNGAVSNPNKGMNMASTFLNLRCNITNAQLDSSYYEPKGSYKPRYEINTIVSTGRRSVKETKTKNIKYIEMLNLSAEYLRPVGNNFKWGPVLDLGIDESLNMEVTGDTVLLENWDEQLYCGAALAGQLRANNFAIQADLGYRLFNSGEKEIDMCLYQKIGIRYYMLNQRVFAGIRIKVHHFSRADFIEWSVGYSF